MNEIIKGLVEKATTKEEFYPAGCNGYPEYRYDFSKEKFAELLVKECANIAGQESKAQRTDHGRQAADRIWHTITNRFGV